MMATVPHITSGLGLRKFQADGFLLIRVYIVLRKYNPKHFTCSVRFFKSCFAFVLCLECKTANCQRLLLYAVLCGSALQLDSFFVAVWPERKVETRGQAGAEKNLNCPIVMVDGSLLRI